VNALVHSIDWCLFRILYFFILVFFLQVLNQRNRRYLFDVRICNSVSAQSFLQILLSYQVELLSKLSNERLILKAFVQSSSMFSKHSIEMVLNAIIGSKVNYSLLSWYKSSYFSPLVSKKLMLLKNSVFFFLRDGLFIDFWI